MALRRGFRRFFSVFDVHSVPFEISHYQLLCMFVFLDLIKKVYFLTKTILFCKFLELKHFLVLYLPETIASYLQTTHDM